MTLTLVISGVPIRIVTEDGFTTWLDIDYEGNLYQVRYEDNSRFLFNYQEGGLLTGKTDRRGFNYSRIYDEYGRITEVSDPAGAVWNFFDQRPQAGQNQYGYTSVTGKQYQSVRTKQDDGSIQTTKVRPNNTTTTHIRSEDNLLEQIVSAGMTTVISKIPDPKTDQPMANASTVTLPSGLSLQTTYQKDYAENGADTTRYTLTVEQNERTSTVDIDAQAGLRTVTSPEGRVAVYRTDPDTFLPTSVSLPGLPDTHYTYDSRGRRLSTTIGDRVTTYSYSDPNDQGQLSTLTTADGDTTAFDYDALGRLATTYLPDGIHVIEYGYDENGNLTQLRLPSGELHAFDYTERDQKEVYEPPLPDGNATEAPVGPEFPTTRYSYNLDKQLEAITRLDGAVLDYVYNSITGQLDSLIAPAGTYNYTYYGQNDAINSGQVKTLTAPGGQQLNFQYDGTLVTQIQWSGQITGTLGYQKDRKQHGF